MQAKKYFKTDTIKQISIFLDILVPFLLFFSLNNNNQILSWLLLGCVVFARIFLVIKSK
jgi:hypothetical protein